MADLWREVMSWHEENRAMFIEALVFARKAHKGQKYHRSEEDWTYMQHVLFVTRNVRNSPLHRISALLHDVVEDAGDVSIEDVGDIFGEEIATVVDALTRREEERYWDYISRLRRNEVAKEIKLVDAAHHILNIARWDRTEEHSRLLSRYIKVVEMLFW